MFLRPYVMRTAGATDRLTQDRYDYMRAQQQGFVSPNIMVRDTNTPLLPPADAPATPFIDPRANGPVAAPLPLQQSLPQNAPQPGVPGQPQPMQPAPQQLPQAPANAPQPLSLRGESAFQN
ncbi:hypothetical protein D9M72_363560 [compost metagenome]